MQTLVSIDNAQCRVTRQVLLAIEHFAIEPGQHWCLFGPNGCGKTLLANLLAGKRLESGNYVSYGPNFDPALDLHIVSFEEQQRLWARDNRLDISEFSGDAQDKGTVVEDLIRASRSKQSQNDVLLADLIEQLALAEVLSKGIRFLSSGQIRKVLIARSLYAYRDGLPQLLILDDPLESIDRDSRQGSLAEVLKTSEFADVGVVGIEATANLNALLPHETPIRKRSEELIRLEDVQASYGDIKVLVDVNWIMTGRDHVVIEGPNGSGKSTFLSLIDGENHKGYGQQVFLFGRLKGGGETIWETKKHFGIVSNELHTKYVKGWRVLDVVVSGFFDSVGLYDESGTAEVDLARRWIAALGLEQWEKQYYHEISFGQQRLVLLARAMIKKPRILILDEPCVGLDDFHRQLILRVLDAIAERSLTNILYVTHVADEQPSCINQVLRFKEQDGGGFSVEQVDS
jgi:molybdate transport system ATP-binding protein